MRYKIEEGVCRVVFWGNYVLIVVCDGGARMVVLEWWCWDCYLWWRVCKVGDTLLYGRVTKLGGQGGGMWLLCLCSQGRCKGESLVL